MHNLTRTFIFGWAILRWSTQSNIGVILVSSVQFIGLLDLRTWEWLPERGLQSARVENSNKLCKCGGAKYIYVEFPRCVQKPNAKCGLFRSSLNVWKIGEGLNSLLSHSHLPLRNIFYRVTTADSQVQISWQTHISAPTSIGSEACVKLHFCILHKYTTTRMVSQVAHMNSSSNICSQYSIPVILAHNLNLSGLLKPFLSSKCYSSLGLGLF